MRIVLCLGNYLQGDLYGHPLATDVELFKQLSDSAAIFNVSCFTIYMDFHGRPHIPEHQDTHKIEKAAKAA
jgi:hypothetical protein